MTSTEKPSYKATLNLPKTSFGMRANLAQQEPLSLKRWKKQGLYHSLQEQRQAVDIFAADALKQLPQGNCPNVVTLLTALRLWGFDKNTSPNNVLPDGKDWVYNDTVGLMESRSDHMSMRKDPPP